MSKAALVACVLQPALGWGVRLSPAHGCGGRVVTQALGPQEEEPQAPGVRACELCVWQKEHLWVSPLPRAVNFSSVLDLSGPLSLVCKLGFQQHVSQGN